MADRIEGHYTTLKQDDIDTLAKLVRRSGFAPVLAAIGDILTQSEARRSPNQPGLSFCLGGSIFAAWAVDRDFPPEGA